MAISALRSEFTVIKSIYDYVLKELKDNTSPSKVKSKAISYYSSKLHSKSKRDKNELANTLQKFSFYDNDNYVNEFEINHTIFLKLEILSMFKDCLQEMLQSPSEVDLLKVGPLTRAVSPPKEAYEYIGHNKLDITHSTSSYGFLFE